MNKKKSKIIIVLLLVVLLIFGVSALATYHQDCKQELREVDRYAQPYIIDVMEALSAWNYETIEPFLTENYRTNSSQEEWTNELQKFSRLGGLQSFARPRFVSHTPFKRFWMLESAIDFYAISAEFENANAVVRLSFENKCGDLKVDSIKITSPYFRYQLDDSNDDALENNEAEFEEIDVLNYEPEDLGGDSEDEIIPPDFQPEVKKKTTDSRWPRKY